MRRLRRVILPFVVALGIVSAAPSGANAYLYVSLWTMDALTPTIILALRVIGVTNGLSFIGSWFMREPLMGMALFVSCLFVVDSGTTRPQIKYGPVSDADAKSFGLSQREQTAYNEDLPLINVAFDEFVNELKTNSQVQNPHLSQQLRMQLGRQVMGKVFSEAHLSPLTISALHKVTAHSVIITSE